MHKRNAPPMVARWHFPLPTQILNSSNHLLTFKVRQILYTLAIHIFFQLELTRGWVSAQYYTLEATMEISLSHWNCRRQKIGDKYH